MRGSRFVIESLDLWHQVWAISSLIQTSIPRTVQLRLELMGSLPCIQADAAQIQQVVMNLVIDGGKPIPEGLNRHGFDHDRCAGGR
jgi:two-component system CheB/CheR fusion protein